MAEEYVLNINGQEHVTTQNKPLLRYLRDDLKITSAKDGCSEGACGTCTIMVEGLTHEEQEAFVYAFGVSGAVQCGFCIPGMVMAGAALCRRNPDPTAPQIAEAIRGNVCRCTGYKRILVAIKLAAAILRCD